MAWLRGDRGGLRHVGAMYLRLRRTIPALADAS
jgi:hypothetical protein